MCGRLAPWLAIVEQNAPTPARSSSSGRSGRRSGSTNTPPSRASTSYRSRFSRAADATTAADWGLVNRAVPGSELDAEVAALVARVTRGSAYSRSLGKRTFYAQVGLPQRQAYDLAIEVMAAAVTSQDAQEGIAAFLEKRKPTF